MRISTILVASVATLALSAGMALAQEAQIAATANAEEAAAVTATIAQIGCEVGPSPIEKENDNLFEIDDAVCAIGQYDIKLDAQFTIVAMTADGPVHADAAHEWVVTEAEEAAIEEALAAVGCSLEDAEVEKEFENLFEIDDAQCTAGQYDVKLNGEFAILNMTRD